MTDKIIFWITADFISFVIAKGITNKHNAELYAIIDITNKPKKFFQNQRLIKFNKIWFYHDHVKPTKNPDLNYLTSFERKYNINLWTLACNERLFYRFNDYYKFTSEEVLSILEQECKLFEKVLDEVKPHFMIMLDTNFHHDQLFYEICKQKNVKPLILVGTRLARRWTISSITDNVDFLPNKIQGRSTTKSFEELRNYLKAHDIFKLANEVESRFLTSKSFLFKAAIDYLFHNDNSNLRTHYSYYGRTKLKVLIKSIINILKTKYRESFINRNFIREINHNEPFIYFPLHQEPERSLLITAPFYTNELEVITNIVKSLPVGYKLYVKEHPAMKSREWRTLSFYKELMNLPNVVMIHPAVNPAELMKRCSLVITISGTASFESIFYQKPSIVMADTSFSMLSSVHRLKTIEELPQAIRSSLEKKVNDSAELNEYIELVLKNTFEFDFHKLVLDFADRFYYNSSLVDVNISESDVNSFLDDNKETLDNLASQFVKKIEQQRLKST